jgi:UDP-N-acetylglucosamine 1-carboxyvinyltransferase
MDRFIIEHSSLKGEIEVSGSKNATLPIMAATLLSDKPFEIKGVPDVTDIRTMKSILEFLGKKIVFSGDTLYIDSKKTIKPLAPYRLVRKMRGSFCVCGPLLARCLEAEVSLPGGCVIGPRPVDLHMKGFQKLGAKIKVENGYCIARAKKLKGQRIFLGGPFGSSVLATANVMMAAVLAQGQTIIESAACEPEIVDLVSFLRKMGADISGEGTPIIKIKGVKALSGARHCVISDRIEGGTFLAMALATHSPLTIKNIRVNHLTYVLEIAQNIGADLEVAPNRLRVKRVGKIQPLKITTLPYPGFPTDLQAQFMAVLALADGLSLITEKIYPDRFMHIAELNRMGAKIQKIGPQAVVEGVGKLHGAQVMASDLRASAALIIAALAAQGKTEILRIYHLDRGYKRLEKKLQKIGAKIKRIH